MLLWAVLYTFFITTSSHAEDNPYQLGPQWSKAPVNQSNIEKLPKQLRSKAKLVAKFLGGTAFYLGKHDNKHLMATNYHVLPSPLNCYSLNKASFSLLEVSFACKKFIIGIKETDLTIFEIEVPPEIEKVFSKIFITSSNNFNGKLHSFGHGSWANPRRSLLHTSDDFCKAFSQSYRFISDPDTVNPVDYKVWSVPIGCDFSHGDSGSPVFNANGDFVGIFWTGNAPKEEYLKSSSYLKKIYINKPEQVWHELSYMSPADKILNALKQRAYTSHPNQMALESLIKQLSSSN